MSMKRKKGEKRQDLPSIEDLTLEWKEGNRLSDVIRSRGEKTVKKREISFLSEGKETASGEAKAALRGLEGAVSADSVSWGSASVPLI